MNARWRWLVIGSVVGGAYLGSRLLFNWLFGHVQPLWVVVVPMVTAGVVMALVWWAKRRGWISVVLFRPDDGLQARRVALAEERERLAAGGGRDAAG